MMGMVTAPSCEMMAGEQQYAARDRSPFAWTCTRAATATAATATGGCECPPRVRVETACVHADAGWHITHACVRPRWRALGGVRVVQKTMPAAPARRPADVSVRPPACSCVAVRF
uniref:Uncharacterized protein n=1 Tax=Arundo donax TaxID=35708 RepID=A0A0A9G2R2_ARUDO